MLDGYRLQTLTYWGVLVGVFLGYTAVPVFLLEIEDCWDVKLKVHIT